MSLHIITHVVPYLRSIMHMHFYCYLTGGLLTSWTGKVSGATVESKVYNAFPKKSAYPFIHSWVSIMTPFLKTILPF